MKIAIIALLISLAALGLAGFATVRTFNESHPAPPVAESQWSEEECADVRVRLDSMSPSCHAGNCIAYTDLLQAHYANCP